MAAFDLSGHTYQRAGGFKVDRAFSAIKETEDFGERKFIVTLEWVPADSTILCVGDVFRMTVTDRRGQKLLDKRLQVSSQESSPINGPGCPPMCRRVEVVDTAYQTPREPAPSAKSGCGR